MVSTMNEYNIAVLEEELGLFGYLYNKTQACDKSTKFSVSSGWINGKFYKKCLIRITCM